jgi:hypothetical protein
LFRGHKGLKERKVSKVPQELRVYLQEHKVHKEPKELKVQRGQLEVLKELRDLLCHQRHQGLRGPQEV